MIKTTAKDSLNEELDLEVTTTNKIWRQLMAKDKNGATSALKGELRLISVYSCTDLHHFEAIRELFSNHFKYISALKRLC